MRKYIPIVYASFLVAFFSGCLYNQVADIPAERGMLLRNAINAKNFTLLADSTTFPLIVTEQEWETADDGYGYVLGAKNTVVVDSHVAFAEGVRILDSVEILGEAPLDQEFAISDFVDEFSGIDHHWKSLDLVVFLRGLGDVEHIVVLGLDKKSAKLRAIYTN